MNILCLFQKFDFSSSTIYLDLVYALREKGHRVMVLALSSDEKRIVKGEKDGMEYAFVPVPDQFNAGKIKKGLIQLTIGRRILNGVKESFWDEKVDLIIYPTPPVTLSKILKPLKRHYGALNYLMLKDIFPQNAVDLKMMRAGGLLHRLFRGMERELYKESDCIGCMSPANIEYIKKHEAEETAKKTELFPNTVKIVEESAQKSASESPDKSPGENGGYFDKSYVNFIFGGNLGKPQAVDFLLEGIGRLSDSDKACFTFIGSGTEKGKIKRLIEEKRFDNVRLLDELPRREYEEILREADIGIVSLSPGFTIPNFPSRILSYMQMSKPVLAVTDKVTDIGKLVTHDAHCGYYCYSGDAEGFAETVRKIISEWQRLPEYGKNGREYLKSHFNVERSVEILERAVYRQKGLR